MRYFGKFWLNYLNLVTFLLLNPVHGRKNTDSVVNFVFFETLATENSAAGSLCSLNLYMYLVFTFWLSTVVRGSTKYFPDIVDTALSGNGKSVTNPKCYIIQ